MSTALDYKQLITETPPKVIRSEEENRFYLSKLTELAARFDRLTPAEVDLYETLKVLIADFEAHAYPIPSGTPIEIIRELMAANDLKQKDLVDVFGTESVASEVLSGKRQLSKDHIHKLAKRFSVSHDLFY